MARTHIVLALLQQLQLAPQQQYLLLLQSERIIELADRIFLIGKLALHVEQLLYQVIGIGQVTLSPRGRCSGWQNTNILPTCLKNTATV